MEHDLLQNVTERVWLFLPSQGCSIQFLHEEMKLPPPLFPPSLFHLPCAVTSAPIGEFGGFTKPTKRNKEFLLDNILSQIVGHMQGKMKARPLLNTEAAKDATVETEYCSLCFSFPGSIGRSWRKASPGVQSQYRQCHTDGTVARIEGQLLWREANR